MHFAAITKRPDKTQALPADFQQVMQEERLHARKALEAGHLREVWLNERRDGAIVLLEADSLSDAEALIRDFPAEKAGYFNVEIIPLIPITENLSA